MSLLPTVLLEHTAPAGLHYDWLLTSPDDPQGLLWTVRVALSSSAWASLARWDLEEIAPHRRIYLSFEGPLSPLILPDGQQQPRGAVRRVDQGVFAPQLWTAERKVLALQFTACRGTVELSRVQEAHWQAAWQVEP